MGLKLAVVGLAALCLSGSHAPELVTQDRQDPTARPKQPFVLQAGSHGIKEVFTKCANYLGYNLTWAESDFQNPDNKITLTGTVRVDARGCEELFTQLAYSKDFAIVPVDVSKRLYRVIFTRGPHRPEITGAAVFMMPAEVRDNSRKVIYVNTVRKLKHVDPNRASASLRPMFASSGVGGVIVSSAGNSDTLLVQGFSNKVASVLRMLDEIDQPSLQKPSKALDDRLRKIEMRLEVLEKKTGVIRKE